MSEWIHTLLPDGKTQSSCTLDIGGITVNIRYTRPAFGEKELEIAEKPFRDTFYELVREGKAVSPYSRDKP